MTRQNRLSIVQHPSRRDFLKTSMAAAAGAAALGGLSLARGAHAAGDETIKVALIGCGGRGTGAVTQILGTPGPIKLWAMADLFPDQIERSLAILTRGATPRDSYEAKGTFGRSGSTCRPSAALSASTPIRRRCNAAPTWCCCHAARFSSYPLCGGGGGGQTRVSGEALLRRCTRFPLADGEQQGGRAEGSRRSASACNAAIVPAISKASSAFTTAPWAIPCSCEPIGTTAAPGSDPDDPRRPKWNTKFAIFNTSSGRAAT